MKTSRNVAKFVLIADRYNGSMLHLKRVKVTHTTKHLPINPHKTSPFT